MNGKTNVIFLQYIKMRVKGILKLEKIKNDYLLIAHSLTRNKEP